MLKQSGEDELKTVMPKKLKQGGFALLIVIWAIALIAFFAVTFTRTADTQLRLAQNAIDAAKAEQLANMLMLKTAMQLAISAQSRKTRSASRQSMLPRNCVDEEGNKIFVAVADEGGKVDLNAASHTLLKTLLLGLNNDTDKTIKLASAIVDFRDGNDLIHLNGAEKKEYDEAGLAQGPKNAPFDSIEELEQVLGMSIELLEKLKPLVTVHSGRNGIDPEVAPSTLIATLSRLPKGNSTTTSSTRNAVDIPTQFKLQSSRKHFRIMSAAQTPSGGRFVRDAIIEVNKYAFPPFRIKRWQRGEWPTTSAPVMPLSRCNRSLL